MTAASADTQEPGAGTALVVLARLRIKGRAPLTGYSRAQFGVAWTDDNSSPLGHNGCDTRNDILRRDLASLTMKADTGNCVVLTGMLADPYTGHRMAFTRGATTSTAIQIDHVVALGDAWQTGAQGLTAHNRTDLANDPLELLAVDGPTNEAKGDGDAATWLPPNKAYRCAYVARQVAVKARYALWITAAEHDAIARILNTCTDQSAPAETGKPLSTGPATTSHTTARTTAAPTPLPAPSTPPTSETTPEPVTTQPSAPSVDAPPAGATAMCNDGTFSYAAHHQGACSRHGGVATFYR